MNRIIKCLFCLCQKLINEYEKEGDLYNGFQWIRDNDTGEYICFASTLNDLKTNVSALKEPTK